MAKPRQQNQRRYKLDEGAGLSWSHVSDDFWQSVQLFSLS